MSPTATLTPPTCKQNTPNLDPAMRAELLDLLKTHSFKRGDFVLASGERSNFYLDCRITTLNARGSYLAGHLLYQLLAPCPLDSVGGMVLGAAPLVTAITYRSAEAGHPIEGFLVRKATKSHGTGRLIEGNLAPWMRVALVEDVVTTGSSTLQAIEIIRDAYPQLEISGVVSLVDRQAGGAEAFEKLGIPFQSLYSIQEFL